MILSHNFSFCFQQLTGSRPFPWQVALHERFISGDIPAAAGLPTGLGKTSVIAIWLIALAQRPDLMPRRLVYVVNRRTVVDQTTEEVMRLRDRLHQAGLYQALERMSAIPGQYPLAISTLRGQFADNREWSGDPARPAVICGTVDMIGSRLLFGGYGIGFKQRPLHAGFLGQDALVIHDEAHLEPAFQQLLETIHQEQQRCRDFRPLCVMELTATSRGSVVPFTLTEAERSPPAILPDPPLEPIDLVWRRQKAVKQITLHAVDDQKDIVSSVLQRALTYKESDRAVLVFLRTVEDVSKVVTGLVKALGRERVQQLTGTMRGHERDRLASHDPVFARFLPRAVAGTQAVFLVCTAAGEVGVNISADHLICDLTTFDSMAQRLGRVNRFGDRSDSQVYIVHLREFSTDDMGVRLRKTRDLLVLLNGDGCPLALAGLDPAARQSAFAEPPTTLPATDILFDAWALTTIRARLPGRPPVEPYLHGVADWEPPRTQVAWREEVGILGEGLFTSDFAQDLLEDYPLKPHELLSDRSDRIAEQLAILASNRPLDYCWLVADDGTISRPQLKALADDPKRIEQRTMLHAPATGGLRQGMLEGSEPQTGQLDVADFWTDSNGSRRIRVWDDTLTPPGMRLIRRIDTRPLSDETDQEDGDGLRWWRWYERPDAADGDGSRAARDPVALSVHLHDVRGNAALIVKALNLSPQLQQAVILAAWAHDLGKDRALWQRSIGNPDPARVLAKSGRGMTPLDLTMYRHEFGSLADVQHHPDYLALGQDRSDAERAELRDLVLHLIAAHHGRARPHFPADEAFDPHATTDAAEAVATAVSLRFSRLQQRFGRWGLAYLESLVRAADYAASANPSAYDTPIQENTP